jgi:hypothetical protein
MKNLIHKIFPKLDSNKPKIKRVLNADEIKPIFEANGINIETIGFPCINERHYTPLDSYWADFKDVNIIPVKVDNKVLTIITGQYVIQAKASYQDKSGGWHPGTPAIYPFKIQEGKLDLGEDIN